MNRAQIFAAVEGLDRPLTPAEIKSYLGTLAVLRVAECPDDVRVIDIGHLMTAASAGDGGDSGQADEGAFLKFVRDGDPEGG